MGTRKNPIESVYLGVREVKIPKCIFTRLEIIIINKFCYTWKTLGQKSVRLKK